MRSFPRRGARVTAPLALVTLAVAGCGSSHHTTGATPPATVSSPAAVAATTDAAAARTLAAAERTLARDRSYRFAAVETVAANKPVTTRLSGTVVRKAGVSYTLVVGHTRTQVVRLRTATYVRAVPGHWAKLRHKTPVVDPTASLGALLRGLAGVSTAAGGAVTGTVSGAAARAAGIPTGTAPARVTVTLDRLGHVVSVAVRTTTDAGGKSVAVTLATSYSAFDRAGSLHAPV